MVKNGSKILSKMGLCDRAARVFNFNGEHGTFTSASKGDPAFIGCGIDGIEAEVHKRALNLGWIDLAISSSEDGIGHLDGSFGRAHPGHIYDVMQNVGDREQRIVGAAEGRA